MLTTTPTAIFWNTHLLAFNTNGQTLVRTTARTLIGTDPANHLAFDTAMAKLGGTIVYVTGFSTPAAQFKAWAKTGGPAPVALTDEEQGLPAQLKALQARIDALATRFTALTLPKAPPPPYTFSTKAARGRLVVKNKTVANTSYSITLASAKALAAYAMSAWAGRKDTDNGYAIKQVSRKIKGSYRTIRVRADRIEIGCQTVYRADVEKLALEQGWVTKA